MNVVIDEPYPEMFTTVEKKVFDKILAFAHIQQHSAHPFLHSFFHMQNAQKHDPHRTENVTYEYTVTPKSHGPTTVPRTHITYDDSNEAHIDAELRLLVESPEEYAKRTDRHIVCLPLPSLTRDHSQRVSLWTSFFFSCTFCSRLTGSSTLLPLCWLRVSPPSSSTRRTRRSSEPSTDGLVPGMGHTRRPRAPIPTTLCPPATHTSPAAV